MLFAFFNNTPTELALFAFLYIFPALEGDNEMKDWELLYRVIQKSLITELLTTPENTITHHNALCFSPQNFV